MGSLDRAADATVAVWAGARAGSGVLIDGRHVLTAQHVIRGRGDRVIEVAFPRLGSPAEFRLPATPLVLGAAADELDIAVLDLGVSPPEWLCPPAAVWPGQRLPAELSAFGYPLSEGQLRGVWRDSTLSGAVADGRSQLDWAADAGTMKGHSGGPIVDRASGAVVGILVEGAAAGRFDRMVPVPEIRKLWPGMPHPWLFAGLEAVGHFSRRARGQLSAARGGDLFRGRQAALSAARAWLTDPAGLGRLLVVTGQPGAGKSALVARVAQRLHGDGMSPGLAFHARGAAAADVVDSMAVLCGLDTPASGTDLVLALRDIRGADQRWVVVDALDEAASEQDCRDIAELLRELARLPWLRVAVATRSRRVGEMVGRRLRSLGISSFDAANLIDLDSDEYFDPAGLESYASAVLAQDGMDQPGPPGAAWERYRADDSLRLGLAQVIAARADRNYLVAAITALQFAEEDTPADAAHREFDPTAIPSGVGEALTRYLGRLDGSQGEGVRWLLTSLAYARGDGVDDQQWLSFAAALGHPCEAAQLEVLRDSAAADYLLHSEAGDGQLRTRLFHQALADELRVERPARQDEHRLYAQLMSEVRATGWRQASGYARMHAASHAAAAGELDTLVNDCEFLLYADPARLSRVLGTVKDRDLPLVRLYWRVVDQLEGLTPAQRAAAFHIAAARDEPRALPMLKTEAVLPWRGLWGRGDLLPFHRRLIGHTDWVRCVAFGVVGGQTWLASTGTDQTVRLWNAVTGEHEATLTGHEGAVVAAAFGNGLLATGSEDRTVRLWNPVTNEHRATLTGSAGPVRSVTFGLVDGRSLLAAGSDDGIVRLWDPVTGDERGTLQGQGGPVRSVAFGQHAGRTLLAAGSDDCIVRLWDPVTGGLVMTLTGHRGPVWAIDFGHVDERPLLATGATDNTIRLWNLDTGEQHAALTGHSGPVWAVAFSELDRRPLLASGSSDRTVRLWEPAAGSGQHRATFAGHSGTVWSVVSREVSGRTMLASASSDRTIRLWDPATGQDKTAAPAHRASVRSIAFGESAGRALLATGSGDSTARLWDPVTGEHRHTLSGHTARVMSVAFDEPGTTGLLATCSGDKTVRLWDAATGALRRVLDGHEDTVRSVAFCRGDGLALLASGSSDGTARLWDIETGRHVSTLGGRHGPIMSVACGVVDGATVVATGGTDRTASLWDPVTCERRQTFIGHEDTVWSLAFGQVAGRALVATGSSDGTARVWDPVTGDKLAVLTGHEDIVGTVAFGRSDGRELLATGSSDRTVRLWDPLTGEFLDSLTGPDRSVWAVALGQADDKTLLAIGGPDHTVLVVEMLRYPRPNEPV